MTGGLEGIRIVELAGLGPAPFAGMMLADHGAEVIRVPPLKPRRGIPTVDTTGDLLARNRSSIAVDLKTPEGRELVLDMINRADGVIEGFRPGVVERLGIGSDDCLTRNERLVYGRMTGWGQYGPLAASAGHDINYLALSGVLHAIGPHGQPAPPLNLTGDFGGGGMLLAFGMLAAILHARTSGRGQVVDAAITDGAALLATMIYGLRAEVAWNDRRESNLLDGGAYFYGVYRCSDDGFIAVGSIEPQFHSLLLKGLGSNQLSSTRTTRPAGQPRVKGSRRLLPAIPGIIGFEFSKGATPASHQCCNGRRRSGILKTWRAAPTSWWAGYHSRHRRRASA